MDEQKVRLLVRQAIARHMGTPEASAPVARTAPGLAAAAPSAMATAVASVPLAFARFDIVRPAGDTECIIEPTVTCNHCGHCQCYGH